MEARSFLRNNHISPALVLCHEHVLQNKNYSISFNKVISITVPFTKVTFQTQFDNVYQGKLPDVFILAMVSDTDLRDG